MPVEAAEPAGGTVDIADTIEGHLETGDAGVARACIALHRHKRTFPDENVEWLEAALHIAKRPRAA